MLPKILKAVGILLVFLILLIVSIPFLIQMDYFRGKLKGFVEKQVSSSTNQQFTIGKIEDDFISGIGLKDVTFQVEGEPFVRVEELAISYSELLDVLFSRVVSIDEALLRGVNVNLVKYPDGTWNFSKLGGEKQEKKKEEEEKPSAPPNWDIFLRDFLLENAEIRVDNRETNEVTQVAVPKVNLSLSMIDVTRRVEIDLKNAEAYVSPQDIDLNRLTAKAFYSETDGEARIENLEAILNGAEVKLDADVQDFKKPEFKLDAAVYGYDVGKGVLSAEVKGSGQYKSPEDIEAEITVNIPESQVMGKKVRGSIQRIEMDGTEIQINDGTIQTGFGETFFGGSVNLERILTEEGTNEFNLDLALKNIDIPTVLDLFKDKIKQQPNISNAILNADFDIGGSWKEIADLQAKVDINEFRQEGNAGTIDLDGIVEVESSDVAFDISSSLKKVDVGLILNDPQYASNLNSDLQLEGSVPTKGDLLENLNANAKVNISPSSFSDININEGEIDASYSDQTLDINSFSLISDAFKINAKGTRGSEEGINFTYDIDVNDLSFVSKFKPGLDLRGSLSAEGSVEGQVQSPEITLSATVSGFGYKQDIEIGSGNIGGNGVVDLENPQLQLDGDFKQVKLQGRNIESVDLQVQSVDKGIRADIYILEDPERNYTIALKLADLMSQEKKIEIEKIKLDLENNLIENRETINVTVSPEDLIVDQFNLYYREGFVLADADVDFDGGIDADLRLNNLDLGNISQVLEIDPPIQGIVSGDARLQGTMEKPNIKANIGAANLEAKKFKSDRTVLNFSYLNKELDLNLNVMQNAKEILRVSGGANVDLNLKKVGENIENATFDLTVRSDGINFTDVSQALELETPLQGVATADIRLQGSMENPNIKANIGASNLGYKKFQSDRLALALSYLNEKLDINLNVTQNAKEILSINGGANVDLNFANLGENLKDAAFDLMINSSGLELSTFAGLSEQIKKLDGMMFIDLNASGSAQAPMINGQVRVQDVSLRTQQVKNEIRIPNGLVEMQGEKGFLKTLEIRTGDDGVGTFQGDFDLRRLSYSLSGEMREVQIEPESVSVKLNGDVNVEGSDGKISAAGDIEIPRLRFTIPEQTEREFEEIKFVDKREKPEEEFKIEAAEEDDYFEENVALDFEVSIPRNAWVRGKGANIELQGDIGVNKEFGQPVIITGSINTLKGTYEVVGKLFEIEEGTVSFQGTPEINPFLDIVALYQVEDVDVFVNIGGTVEKPKLELTSDPNMDETDIFSYLVFGTSSDKIGAGERVSLQSRAGQVLGNLAAGQIKGLVGQEFAPDVLRIRGGENGPELELGKYITDDLYIAYERGTKESTDTTAATSTNRFRVEYSLFDFLTLETDLGGEQAGGDVFFNFDYSLPFLQ